MHGLADVAGHALEQQLDADDLQAARRGARAATDGHQDEQQHAAELRPEVEVLRGVARGGDDG